MGSLLSDTQLCTFGAPSLLVEPTKLSLAEWGIIAGATGMLFATGYGKFVDDLWAGALNEVLTVDGSLIPTLTGFNQNVFQFEHMDTSHADDSTDYGLHVFYDPVATLGNIDAGTEIEIDLTSTYVKRYHSNAGLLGLHSMGSYIESIARLITSSDLIKTDSTLTGTSPTLPSSALAQPVMIS